MSVCPGCGRCNVCGRGPAPSVQPWTIPIPNGTTGIPNTGGTPVNPNVPHYPLYPIITSGPLSVSAAPNSWVHPTGGQVKISYHFYS